MSQSINVLQKSRVDDDLRSSLISFLEVTTFSFKALAYHIPLASCFGGDFVTHKSRHHHVMRSQASFIALKSQVVK